ncbi:MAG: SMI1/KNR4 family protein [Clostridiales bacterium]|nr:SMI1/KNR4 family protein [Clostridiales bacterium]
MAREKLIDDARQAFESNTDRPETNTIKLTSAGIEFFVDGLYVCEKDFKNVDGNHLAFDILSTRLKYMPDDYDDVCDLESIGVLAEIGYLDGEPLEKYANDNGVILQDTLENSIGNTITLHPDEGYNAIVSTAESDSIDYGFVKILGLANNVLTVYFSLTVSCGLCDTVEGVVELKKDTLELKHDIDSLLDKVKRKRFNTIEVDKEEVRSIKQANPFLPDSYITFLKEVGFVDFNWIDVGWNNKTPTNLDDYTIDGAKDIFANYKDLDVNNYYFIGIDNDDRHYAFSRKADDRKVYVFSDNEPKNLSYETFEEFVREILST